MRDLILYQNTKTALDRLLEMEQMKRRVKMTLPLGENDGRHHLLELYIDNPYLINSCLSFFWVSWLVSRQAFLFRGHYTNVMCCACFLMVGDGGNAFFGLTHNSQQVKRAWESFTSFDHVIYIMYTLEIFQNIISVVSQDWYPLKFPQQIGWIKLPLWQDACSSGYQYKRSYLQWLLQALRLCSVRPGFERSVEIDHGLSQGPTIQAP